VASLAATRDPLGQEQDPKSESKQEAKPAPKQDPERERPVAVVPVADDEATRKF
jgi:hypothetical protein